MPQLTHKKLIALLAPVGLITGMAISAQALSMAHGGIKPYAQDNSASVVNTKSGCLLTRGGNTKPMSECGHMMDGDADGDGVKDSMDKCPNTPKGAPVDAKGCPLDSDGDGVPDYKDKCPGTRAGAKVDMNGCEVMAKVETVTVDNTFLFAHDSAALNMGATDVLDDAYAKFKGNPNVAKVTIVGHTDSSGSAEYNQGLSERRANAVRDYLIGAGADGSKLTAVGAGETQPAASNATKEGRALNRRVEFKVQMR